MLTDTTAHAPSVGKQRQDKKGGRGEAALVTRALHHTGSLPCEPALELTVFIPPGFPPLLEDFFYIPEDSSLPPFTVINTDAQ